MCCVDPERLSDSPERTPSRADEAEAKGKRCCPAARVLSRGARAPLSAGALDSRRTPWEDRRRKPELRREDGREGVEIMRSIVLGLLVMATAAGCAAARNTPAQELACERWGACNRFYTITLDRIELDGRLVVNAYLVDSARFSECVREAAADQVRRGAAPVPQAVVLVKIYGCQGGAM